VCFVEANRQSLQPWYLTTFGVAEQLYYALSVWEAQEELEITSVSLPFFQQFSPKITTGNYSSSSDDTFASIIESVRAFADGFIAVAATYTPADGSLTEQYSKVDGTPTSAVHLTWSYASALTAFAARNGTKVNSWGAKGLSVPKVCEGNLGPQANVTFNVVADTFWGREAFL
jgi:glucoamylase